MGINMIRFRSPDVFGEKHILGVVILFVFSAGFLVWLALMQMRQKPWSHRWLMIFTVGFFILESLRLYFLWDKGSLSIIQLPLQLCSIPLYAYPILSFNKGRPWVQQWFFPTAFATTMLAGIIALAIPSNILGSAYQWWPIEQNYVEIASFVYHAWMVVAPLALIILGYYVPRLKHIPYALAVVSVYAVIAMSVNAWLNTDFLLLNRGQGSPFQFLNATSPLLYKGVMIGLAALLISIFFVVSEGVYQLQHKAIKQTSIESNLN
jgi:uncharacterized membrane protein YwaF